MKEFYKIYPIGIINKNADAVKIDIKSTYIDALLGLEPFSHIMVFYWFHNNDNTENRNILRVHPRKDKKNPLCGVFATHAPLRPNLIGFSICKVLSVKKSIIQIDDIDALDETPVIDIKPFIPSTTLSDVKMPEWV